MNIEEIKAREQAATPEPWHTEKVYHDEPGYEKFIKSARVSTEPDENHSTATITMNNWSNPAINDLEFIAHARTDIPELIAEVERLTKENSALQSANDKLAKQNKHIIGRNIDCSAKNITLKKALELACEALSNTDSANYPEVIRVCIPKSTNEYMDDYIQQAEQLTYKTQEAEK